MRDIAISGDDIEYPLRLVEREEHLAQSLRVRFKFFMGEWFLDINKGIPYYQQILRKQGKGKSIVDAIMKQAISETPGVKEIISFQSTLDASTRNYVVKFSVRSIYGEVTSTWQV